MVGIRKFSALVLLAMLWPVYSCAASGGPVEGEVFDEETGKPIEGAIVVARWTAQLNQIADSSTMCYHVETTTTDAEGRYRIERWHSGHPGMLQQLAMFDREVYVIVYKNGYRMADRHEKDKIGMVPFVGTREERLEYLKHVNRITGCHSAGHSKKNLLPLREVLYGDANKLLIGTETEGTLEDFLYSMEIIELGYERAQERHLERLGSHK